MVVVSSGLGSGDETDGVPAVRCSCLGSGSARGEGCSGAPPVGVCVAGRPGAVDRREGADVTKERSSSRSAPPGTVPGAASEAARGVPERRVVGGEPLWSLNRFCVGDIPAVEEGNGRGSCVCVFVVGVGAGVDSCATIVLCSERVVCVKRTLPAP